MVLVSAHRNGVKYGCRTNECSVDVLIDVYAPFKYTHTRTGDHLSAGWTAESLVTGKVSRKSLMYDV